MIKHKKIENHAGGFTLVEVVVAVSIFTIIMVISMGSILAVFDANKKSQNLRSVMDNLNFATEAMTRTIRFGTNYHCDINTGVITSPRDCVAGADSISVLDSTGAQVTYKLSQGVIVRSVAGIDTKVTSSDLNIQTLAFRVFGSSPYSGGDTQQPEVVLDIAGYVGAKQTTKSSFSLQTTVSQRVFDSQ